ncbi:hypothetical protein Cni_G13300 [Canna indica]|uniref:Endonuclease/exonuclease/phosphatase domain-containing protein n=1 Tax=Canna indica TaxID=4628 RepID=A0AAQ3KB28_9LILI|nr:hypothetical protein Cni_G13300 [Canna indica]
MDLIILQEIHLLLEEAEDFLFKHRRVGSGEIVPSRGRSGGIMVLWKNKSLEVKCVYKDEQCINCLIKQKNVRIFLVSGIYDSTNYMKRNEMWKMYKDLKMYHPWVIAGDMNCIRDSSDKLGGRDVTNSKAIRDFNSLIDEAGHMEVSFKGPKYTWTNNRKGNARVHARLDRVLVNSKWLDINMEMKEVHLQRV